MNEHVLSTHTHLYRVTQVGTGVKVTTIIPKRRRCLFPPRDAFLLSRYVRCLVAADALICSSRRYSFRSRFFVAGRCAEMDSKTGLPETGPDLSKCEQKSMYSGEALLRDIGRLNTRSFPSCNCRLQSHQNSLDTHIRPGEIVTVRPIPCSRDVLCGVRFCVKCSPCLSLRKDVLRR